MRILMVTNTYRPHVGGVANSVYFFSQEYLRQGHQVLLLCPDFPGEEPAEPAVLKVKAWQNFNSTDFSVALALPQDILPELDKFKPEVIHSHHPFLLGDTALRLAAHYDVPLVFTHHTLYEEYTHYIPGDCAALKQYAIELSTGYANLCNAVIAPSESIADLIRLRGVESRIEVIPTGVSLEALDLSEGEKLRLASGIPPEARVLGHVGRLAPEKNIGFLTDSVIRAMKADPSLYFLVVGEGTAKQTIKEMFAAENLSERLRLLGTRTGRELLASYQAMDVFVFASKTETQGLVLLEALVAGLPLVALDAAGVREVLRSGENGIMLGRESTYEFATAIATVLSWAERDKQGLRERVRATAVDFSIERSAAKSLALYERLQHIPRVAANLDDSLWWRTLRNIQAEWAIWSNRAGSAFQAVNPRPGVFSAIISFLAKGLSAVSRNLSRLQLVTRLLGLPKVQSEILERGLILIQIDGLSLTELQHALSKRRLPFLQKLINSHSYELRRMYSGFPSTTPVVQGKLFYGVEQAVPAFEFLNKQTREVELMLDPSSALPVERALEAQSPGILKGGSAYSNIYSGGARETHFCASSIGLGDFLYTKNPLRLGLILLTYFGSMLRLGALLVVEFLLALVDCLLGINQGYELWKEIKFVPLRVGVCLLLRELITLGACLDVYRGLPVIHLNFIGYDEQAHRRGPSARFAHWALKGIDDCIRRIAKEAERSAQRTYEVWLYSDHGQTASVPYKQEFSRTMQQAVKEVFREYTSSSATNAKNTSGEATARASWLGGKFLANLGDLRSYLGPQAEEELVVTDLGPLAHVYLPATITEQAREECSRRLSLEAKIPLVLRRLSDGRLKVYREQEEFFLPEDAAQIFSEQHPFLSLLVKDVLRLAEHPQAGDIILLGFRKDAKSLSFALEHGAHAGPSPLETEAFCLLPLGSLSESQQESTLGVGDLREAIVKELSRTEFALQRETEGRLRVMTYNVHSCVGVDKVLSVERIAQVIRLADVDVVALQEIDVGQKRTARLHQIELLAKALNMHHVFHPLLGAKGELYGDAILSRYPISLIKLGGLPVTRGLEPRGAILVKLQLAEQSVYVLNTHLGLNFAERRRHAASLLSEEWLGQKFLEKRLIVCGDFNSLPGSQIHRAFCLNLKDALEVLESSKERTFPSYLALGRIDHIFLSPDLKPLKYQIPRTPLARLASDHLPLIVELAV